MLHVEYEDLARQIGTLERVESAGGRLPKGLETMRTRFDDVVRQLPLANPFDIKDAASKLQAYVDSARDLGTLNPAVASATTATAVREVHNIAPAFNIIQPGTLKGITSRAISAGTDDANLRALSEIHTYAGNLVTRFTPP
jgi:hypothetical protein